MLAVRIYVFVIVYFEKFVREKKIFRYIILLYVTSGFVIIIIIFNFNYLTLRCLYEINLFSYVFFCFWT